MVKRSVGDLISWIINEVLNREVRYGMKSRESGIRLSVCMV